MSRPLRRCALALTLVGAVTLAGCSDAEPSRIPDGDHTRPVVISVSPNSPEQVILGEIYLQTLQKQNREVILDVGAFSGQRTRLDRLQERSTDFVIGCTGMYLSNLDTPRAEELFEEIERGEIEDPADATYREYMGALNGRFTSPDPSSAQGCAEIVAREGMPELPQNIVPTFSRDLFNRQELKAITDVTRFLTTEEIAMLIEESQSTSSAATAVEAWLPI
ncbi:hypothetical protein [Corynebacterium sp.]|uniref:hypothetical protein n=1 Tax=Corynebacterium sp. TaxID=1720 RepID=UPI0026E0FD66|nr:hypothetical protein [Corynebacterium sp.]MDO5512261.1 hypothetical protein [Corynebacterium sp.]